MKRWIRYSIVALFIFLTGFQGVIFFFADLGPSETPLIRYFIAFLYYFLCSLLITWLMYPRKHIAFFLMWGIAIVSVLQLRQSFSDPGSLSQIPSMLLIPFSGIYLARIVIFSVKRKKLTLV